MNTTINKDPKKPQYPYLGLWDIAGSTLVVLFYGYQTGTVVHEGIGSTQRVGAHSTTWLETGFKRLAGSVTLNND